MHRFRERDGRGKPFGLLNREDTETETMDFGAKLGWCHDTGCPNELAAGSHLRPISRLPTGSLQKHSLLRIPALRPPPPQPTSHLAPPLRPHRRPPTRRKTFSRSHILINLYLHIYSVYLCSLINAISNLSLFSGQVFSN